MSNPVPSEPSQISLKMTVRDQAQARELDMALRESISGEYWFGRYCESGWTPGSPWKMVSVDGGVSDAGTIIEAEPPRRLVIRWRNKMKPELEDEGDSLCNMEIEPAGTAVKLSITHTIEREPSKLIAAVSGGWPKIICNLKSLLETGSVVLDDPNPAGIQSK